MHFKCHTKAEMMFSTKSPASKMTKSNVAGESKTGQVCLTGEREKSLVEVSSKGRQIVLLLLGQLCMRHVLTNPSSQNREVGMRLVHG